ncbi:OLC1v1017240C2 [Oldenlandia corymbosa var. corymbosa]|uniref:ubiquitinyl hydrolase 1 n=1 Tax=Oldenlandia corymbosa var. corymbosa TaxID=529605 RepID=A0AAV1E8X8_OLDCO|nr:OLC1v1017240C2 [Oldenlandia corymbosa var. corymbosa]
MLLGGDLGFLARVVVAGLVVVFAPVFGFLVRRKWRRSVARQEEIRRLLILASASEEIEREEFEAETGFISYGDGFSYGFRSALDVEATGVIKEIKQEEEQHHVESMGPVVEMPVQAPDRVQLPSGCAACGLPTTRRCAQCKAVKYCNGNCQIKHWRESHRNECRPFPASDQSHEMWDSSSLKPSKNKESETRSNVAPTGDRHLPDTAGRHPKEPRYPDSDIPESLGRDEYAATEIFTEENASHSSLSSSSADGCSESSSGPSTPSSGFWDGDLHSRGTSPFTPDQGRSFLSQKGVAGNVDNIVLPERISPPVSVIKKPTNGSSEEIKVKVNKGCLDTQRSLRISSETHEAVRASISKIAKVATRAEAALSLESEASVLSSGISSETVEDVTAKNSKSVKVTDCEKTARSLKAEACILSPSTVTKQSTKTSSQRSISQEIKASDDVIVSDLGRHPVQTVKSVKAEKAHGFPPSSTDSHVVTQNGADNIKPSVWKVVDQLRASKLARLSTVGVAVENVTRYNSKGLFPYDMFVKLYHWNKVELRPCGLVNCGNSCYANVVLQCMSFTPPLTAYFLQGLHSKSCQKSDWCFTCELENLIQKAKEGNSPISPSRIISQLQNIGSQLGHGREEDAHEFLRCAIDTMQDVFLKAAGVTASSSLEETTLLGLTFGGYLRSKIECMRCGGKSERHERMMDLTVEIEGDIGTLEEALRQFTHTETLDGENKYHCSRCKSYERAKKKLRVLEAPNILTIALKRFQSGKFGKLNKMIKFPEILDLAPYMSGTSDKSPIYRLYGVIVHLDTMNASFSGHYVCYVKNSQNKWFKIDDSTVSLKPLEKFLY